MNSRFVVNYKFILHNNYENYVVLSTQLQISAFGICHWFHDLQAGVGELDKERLLHGCNHGEVRVVRHIDLLQ